MNIEKLEPVMPRSSLFKIMLIDRGDCTFVKKVSEAEYNGMAAAIVVDNVDWEDVEYVIMSDDGYGEGISIPSMMISKADGEILKTFLNTADQEELEKIVLNVSFEIAAPDNTVDYQLWYTSSDDRSLDFLADMGEYDKKLGKHSAFTPRFVYWECLFCDRKLLEDNCWG